MRSLRARLRRMIGGVITIVSRQAELRNIGWGVGSESKRFYFSSNFSKA
jgi:hypothetical protein